MFLSIQATPITSKKHAVRNQQCISETTTGTTTTTMRTSCSSHCSQVSTHSPRPVDLLTLNHYQLRCQHPSRKWIEKVLQSLPHRGKLSRSTRSPILFGATFCGLHKSGKNLHWCTPARGEKGESGCNDENKDGDSNTGNRIET